MLYTPNPIPAGGGGANSKSSGLRLFKIFDFYNYHMPFTVDLKRGFYTNIPESSGIQYLDPLPGIGFRLLSLSMPTK